jgi:hypothetical protein
MPLASIARSDRNVLRCQLKIRPGAPVHRLATALEEALRFASLPGESEGRVYYFRRLHIPNLPPDGNRLGSQRIVESILQIEAGRAIHGASPAARYSNAVYFHSAEDACSSLLFRIAHRHECDAWYWHSVSNSQPAASASVRAMDAIEALSRTEASWFAVASVLLAFDDPAAIFQILSEDRSRRWLDALQPAGSRPAPCSSAALPSALRHRLRSVATAFHPEDPRLLLATSLAILLVSPSELEGGRLISRALATLSDLRSGQTGDASHRIGPQSEDSSIAAPPVAIPSQDVTAEHPDPLHEPLHRDAAPASRIIGQRTEYAGLYFLLNVFNHLRLPVRYRQPQFLARFFLRSALHLDIPVEDPILFWANEALISNETSTADRQILDKQIFDRLLRRVQRWCWKNAAIGLAGIINRRGFVTLTPTHLDVALPFEAADIRIRRLGLDLDPGWLPWFGRVVHFHYKDRGDLA